MLTPTEAYTRGHLTCTRERYFRAGAVTNISLFAHTTEPETELIVVLIAHGMHVVGHILHFVAGSRAESVCDHLKC